MMSGKLGEDKQNKQESRSTLAASKSESSPSHASMAGPGAISSTIVYGARYPTAIDTVGISITVGLFVFAHGYCFALRH